MKKLLAILLAMLSVVSLVACGNGYSKKEVSKYLNVTDYKNGLVTKDEYDEEYETQFEAVKDSYCTPEEVAGETKVKDGHIVNATYETILTIGSATEAVEITVGENSLVGGDRTGDDKTTTQTFDNSLVGLTVGKETTFTYTFSAEYGKDAEGKDTVEKYLRNKKVNVKVTVTEIDGKTDSETKVANGNKIKLTYTITLTLTDFSGTKKDITIGETKLGDIISVDEVLKELTTPKAEEKKEEEHEEEEGHEGHDHATEETEEVDYKLPFEKKDVTLEGDKLDEYLKGKTVNVSGTVHVVKEKPAFTDALVKEKSEGMYETIADLEKAVVDAVATDLGMNKLIEKSLIKKTLPRGDIEEAYDMIEKNIENYYYMFLGSACLTSEDMATFVYTYGSYLGITVADTKVSTLTKTIASNAAAVVKQDMLVYYVADAENIEVSGKEYDAYVKEQAKASGVSKKEFVKNSGGKDGIEQTLLYNEVAEFLRDQVKAQLNLK